MVPVGSHFTKRQKFTRKCKKCFVKFMAADVKAKICFHCKEQVELICSCGCDQPFKRIRWRANQGSDFIVNHQKRGKNYLEIYGTKTPACGYQPGELNIAKQPEIGKRISKTLKDGAHAVFKAEHYSTFVALGRQLNLKKPYKRSRLEDKFGQAFPGFRRQFKIGWYSIDFANPSEKLAVEIHGCWWHCCSVCNIQATTPSQHKTLRNDKRKASYLKRHGWSIQVIWEHELNEQIQNNSGNWNRRRPQSTKSSFAL